MKCSNCGADIADGAKFCGECGTKVPTSNKCPECGTICAPGVKFCSECGHKMSEPAAQKPTESEAEGDEETPIMTVADFFGDGGEDDEAKSKSDVETLPEGTCKIDWDGKAKISEMSMPLDDGQVSGIKTDLESLQLPAGEGRVLLASNDGFKEKLLAFKSVYEERIGVNCDECPLFKEWCLIGLVDNSKAGTGKRGTLFTRLGMIVIDGDYPAAVENDEPLDGIVPWKLFYLFAEPADDFYRLMRPITASKSNMVDDAIKSRLKADIEKPNGRNNLLFRYSNVGIDKKEVADFMNELKASLADYDEAYEDED